MINFYSKQKLIGENPSQCFDPFPKFLQMFPILVTVCLSYSCKMNSPSPQKQLALKTGTLSLMIDSVLSNNLPLEKEKSLLKIEIPNNISKITAKIWQELHDRQEELNICDNQNDFYIFQYFPSVYKIEEGTYFVDLVCGRGYNKNHRFYLYIMNQEKKATIIHLPVDRFSLDRLTKRYVREQFPSIGGIYSRYNPEENILKVASKYLASGTCGSFAKYRLDLENTRLELLEYRSKECYPDAPITTPAITPPETYPLIYP